MPLSAVTLMQKPMLQLTATLTPKLMPKLMLKLLRKLKLKLMPKSTRQRTKAKGQKLSETKIRQSSRGKAEGWERQARQRKAQIVLICNGKLKQKAEGSLLLACAFYFYAVEEVDCDALCTGLCDRSPSPTPNECSMNDCVGHVEKMIYHSLT